MRAKKLGFLITVWAISIILFGAITPTYLVEKSIEIFNTEFPSKEAYVLTVEIVQWVRWLYFAVLAVLTFYLFQRHRRESGG